MLKKSLSVLLMVYVIRNTLSKSNHVCRSRITVLGHFIVRNPISRYVYTFILNVYPREIIVV